MNKDLTSSHLPVLVSEVLEALHITPEAKIIDATLGAGGHTLEFLRQGAAVLALETDPKMYALAQERLKQESPSFGTESILVHANFVDIKKIAQEHSFSPVKGILFDLGISSYHLDQDLRGFSFKDPDAPLDMRLDQSRQEVKAADLLNILRFEQLVDMFLISMPYKSAKILAEKVISQRQEQKFFRVGDLLTLFGKGRPGKIHPATRAMMALRIIVNCELENLTLALERAYELLMPKGKLAVISFHSGEDRVVKNKFKSWKKLGWGRTQGPIKPGLDERTANPRARSASLRIFEKEFS